jgi:hypothetical protein
LSTSPFKQFIKQQSIALAWFQEAPEVIAKPNHVTTTNWVSNSWNHVGVHHHKPLEYPQAESFC